MGNCDGWVTVDFGRGPVDIRCTRTGRHTVCETHVIHQDNPDIEHEKRRNVFDSKG